MLERLRFHLSRLRERLWVRPLAMAILSIGLVFLAEVADGTDLKHWVPRIREASVEKLLEILSASMLVIATFAVASMVSAYASAAQTATPRAFVLVVADDVSQSALSRFIGAFIFSVIALIALENGYYERAGIFVLFVVTLGFFLLVVATFVRWVDRIARLGRMSNTLAKVEAAAGDALERRRCAPALGGVPLSEAPGAGRAVHARAIGYLQRVDVAALQAFAVEHGARIVAGAIPGAFIDTTRPLAWVVAEAGAPGADLDLAAVAEAFEIGASRSYDDDPRFGLIVLSEIASRALSPAVNDPGTAIDVLGRLLRLLARTVEPLPDGEAPDMRCERVAVPRIVVTDMFDDAFNAIARDGAGTVEVMLRLQKALAALALLGDPSMREAAVRHGRRALARAERALDLPEDLARVRVAARFAAGP